MHNGNKKLQSIIDWIEQAARDSPHIHQLTDELGSISFDFKRAYKAAWLILSANMQLTELNIEDFQEWFDQLATRRSGQTGGNGVNGLDSDAKYIDIKSKEG